MKNTRTAGAHSYSDFIHFLFSFLPPCFLLFLSFFSVCEQCFFSTSLVQSHMEEKKQRSADFALSLCEVGEAIALEKDIWER